ATVHRDLARRRGFEPHGDAQRRGLAAAGGSDERDDLAVPHGEAHAAERLHGLERAIDAQREPFRYVMQGHLTHAALQRSYVLLPIRSLPRTAGAPRPHTRTEAPRAALLASIADARQRFLANLGINQPVDVAALRELAKRDHLILGPDQAFDRNGEIGIDHAGLQPLLVDEGRPR